MGLQISDIIKKKEVKIEDLKEKTIVVDAFNIIYQFLSSIRQPDGTPLMDSNGKITSHLSGLFYRNMALLNQGMKLIYVFDGEAPKLKSRTHEKRKEMRDIAQEMYERAKEREDTEEMGKYAKQLTGLDGEKIEESKELLRAMGIAVIQAPGEGEAQASYICKQEKEIYAVASQDYDSLLFEAPKLIQNLTLAKKRRTISGFKDITPQLIILDDVKKELNVNQEQLICIGILVGSDYNPSGVKGIGQKKALKLVQEHKTPEEVFKTIEESEKYELNFDWKEIFEEIKNPKVDKNYKIEFSKFDEEKIVEILKKRDFSEERIRKQFEKIKELKEKNKQKTLF